MIYNDIGDHGEALRPFEVVLDKLDRQGTGNTDYERRCQLFSATSCAQIHVDRGQPDKGIEVLVPFIQLNEKESDDVDMRLCLEQQAIAYAHSGSIDNLEMALSRLDRALAHALEVGSDTSNDLRRLEVEVLPRLREIAIDMESSRSSSSHKRTWSAAFQQGSGAQIADTKGLSEHGFQPATTITTELYEERDLFAEKMPRPSEFYSIIIKNTRFNNWRGKQFS